MSEEHTLMTIIAATQNKNKIKEIEFITKQFGMNVMSMKDAGLPDTDIEETGNTFEENSFIKAEAIMELSGQTVVADDSGIMVDALDGAPGVYSARFAGEVCDDEKNNDKLLELLKDVPEEKRTAKFVSVITLLYPDGRKLVARGECPGRINFAPRGTNGFGYDPIFIPDGYNKTYAELTQDEKNHISHRAKALEKLKQQLKEE
jgi:XTP/dITP diphosphohydrolase